MCHGYQLSATPSRRAVTDLAAAAAAAAAGAACLKQPRGVFLAGREELPGKRRSLPSAALGRQRKQTQIFLHPSLRASGRAGISMAMSGGCWRAAVPSASHGSCRPLPAGIQASPDGSASPREHFQICMVTCWLQ